MELTPLSHHQIDRRLREIDRQIHTALRDIRRNLEELEKAAPPKSAGTSATAGAKGFSDVLRQALDDDG